MYAQSTGVRTSARMIITRCLCTIALMLDLKHRIHKSNVCRFIGKINENETKKNMSFSILIEIEFCYKIKTSAYSADVCERARARTQEVRVKHGFLISFSADLFTFFFIDLADNDFYMILIFIFSSSSSHFVSRQFAN